MPLGACSLWAERERKSTSVALTSILIFPGVWTASVWTDGGDLFDGENHAGFVVGPHDGDDCGIGADRLVEQVQIQRAVRFDRKIGHVVTSALEEFAKIEVGGMFHGRSDDVAFVGLEHQGAMDCRIVALRPATGEEDFFRLGIDERRNLGSSFLDGPGHLASELVSARRISPMLGQERKHRLEHFRRHLGRGVIVEIIDAGLAHSRLGNLEVEPKSLSI